MREEKKEKRVEKLTRKWEEVSEGIFVNRESWERRLARYQKARGELQEIMMGVQL